MLGKPRKPRQIAMAKIVIRFQKIDDEEFTFEWEDYPLKYSAPERLPHSQAGIQYTVSNERIFIPWHQIKISSLKETILWDDNK